MEAEVACHKFDKSWTSSIKLPDDAVFGSVDGNFKLKETEILKEAEMDKELVLPQIDVREDQRRFLLQSPQRFMVKEGYGCKWKNTANESEPTFSADSFNVVFYPKGLTQICLSTIKTKY